MSNKKDIERQELLQDMRDRLIPEINMRLNNINKALYNPGQVDDIIKTIAPELTQLQAVINRFKTIATNEYISIQSKGRFNNIDEIVKEAFKPGSEFKTTNLNLWGHNHSYG